jgi:hypothetical protein
MEAIIVPRTATLFAGQHVTGMRAIESRFYCLERDAHIAGRLPAREV